MVPHMPVVINPGSNFSDNPLERPRVGEAEPAWELNDLWNALSDTEQGFEGPSSPRMQLHSLISRSRMTLNHSEMDDLMDDTAEK